MVLRRGTYEENLALRPGMMSLVDRRERGIMITTDPESDW